MSVVFCCTCVHWVLSLVHNGDICRQCGRDLTLNAHTYSRKLQTCAERYAVDKFTQTNSMKANSTIARHCTLNLDMHRSTMIRVFVSIAAVTFEILILHEKCIKSRMIWKIIAKVMSNPSPRTNQQHSKSKHCWARDLLECVCVCLWYSSILCCPYDTTRHFPMTMFCVACMVTRWHSPPLFVTHAVVTV